MPRRNGIAEGQRITVSVRHFCHFLLFLLPITSGSQRLHNANERRTEIDNAHESVGEVKSVQLSP